MAQAFLPAAVAMLSLVVSTSRAPNPHLDPTCEVWAERLRVPFVQRNDRSVAAISRDEGVEGVLVISVDRPPTFMSADQSIRYYYHPGMALTRIRNIIRGMGDPMVRAMRLAEGDSVLDCTLGRASDALVAAYVVGETGCVIGIESSPILAQLTIEGLKVYEPSKASLAPTFRAIDARFGDAGEFLGEAEGNSLDVVYFDPIFGEPVSASSQMQPLRPLADPRPLTPETVAEAQRVARRCVVIKERVDAGLWAELGVDEIVRGNKSTVAYGVLPAGSSD